jgi:hypothetical protein
VLQKKGGAMVPAQEKARTINKQTGRLETKTIQNTKKSLYVDQPRSYSNPISIKKVYPVFE